MRKKKKTYLSPEKVERYDRIQRALAARLELKRQQRLQRESGAQ
jgi:hypothetical protein